MKVQYSLFAVVNEKYIDFNAGHGKDANIISALEALNLTSTTIQSADNYSLVARKLVQKYESNRTWKEKVVDFFKHLICITTEYDYVQSLENSIRRNKHVEAVPVEEKARSLLVGANLAPSTDDDEAVYLAYTHQPSEQLLYRLSSQGKDKYIPEIINNRFRYDVDAARKLLNFMNPGKAHTKAVKEILSDRFSFEYMYCLANVEQSARAELINLFIDQAIAEIKMSSRPKDSLTNTFYKLKELGATKDGLTLFAKEIEIVITDYDANQLKTFLEKWV
jgi:hypothetical protein